MLYFVTTNTPKFDNAQIVLRQYDIQLFQYPLDLTELQSESLKEIAREKARSAYEKVGKPLVVKDDGWYITALNGFPGPYMKYVNEWFSPDDFLNVLKPYDNRELLFRDALCFTDGKEEVFFESTIPGKILYEPKGEGVPLARLATFRKDGKTMAECINEGIHFIDNGKSVWHEFAHWYHSRNG